MLYISDLTRLTYIFRKGVSFLSRFSIISGKKKEQADSVVDDESEPGDLRTEGMNAHVFSSSIGANGYIPQHKEPPRYIKVRAHNKKQREFNRMFLAQELTGSKLAANGDKEPAQAIREAPSTPTWRSKGGAVWATEFSTDGKYLAAAGQDNMVRVWSVISTPEERKAHEQDEDASNGQGERLSAPVFRSKPIREFQGHSGTVLDLSWSKNNFLLSSSMDKTVRLWHISRQECLCTFKHKDFVTSIAFHPRDDRFFLAGSLDSVLRLWSIPDKSVAFWNQLPDLITAVAFTPDGKTAMAGVLSGLCLFYETEGLKYNTQIHVRSSRGKNAKGSKITGIRTINFPDDPEGNVKVLITSNDSRVRLYNLRDKSLEMKFRGHENTCSQIKASLSDDARYIISGSEDRKAYIWSTGPVEAENKDKRPVEHFDAHSDMVTAAVMAPTRTRQLLAASGDPIYDLCNPPPVTLLSMAESRAESIASQDKRNSDPISEPPKKPEESPAYLARCMHNDGNIIITADHSDVIKVFRQDCAYQKRRNDNWETASAFSKKIGPGRLGQSGSSITRGSNSRRNSMSQATVSTQPSSDRILSWRNSIASNTSLEGVGSIRTMQTSRSDRSVSPGKFSRGSSTSIQTPQMTTHSQPNLAITARQQQYTSSPIKKTSSPPPQKPSSVSASQPPTPSFTLQPSEENPLRIDSTGRSYQFWNLQNWRSQFGSSPDPNKLGSDLGLGPELAHRQSVVSKLSSEDNSPGDGESDAEDEALSCKRCGGKDFRAKKAVGRAGQRFVCTKCGMTVE
jgi:WD40 repeat protein